MQAMGTQPNVKVAMSAVQLFRNDCLVICSDGLSNKIPPEEIREMVQSVEDLTEACRSLIDKANERGGEDNITVIIARFDGEALYSASESTSITGSFKALNQGYSSDYFTANTTIPQSPPPEEQETEQKQITKMLNIADLARFDAAAAPSTQNEDSPPVVVPSETEAVVGEDFHTRPTAERPVFEHPAASPVVVQSEPRQPGYLLILIIALISLLLLGATGFFVYSYYLKKKPPAVEPQ
jgi:protein phosphatase